MKKIFKISGMTCHSCAKVIELGLVDEDGIESVLVDFSSRKAFLEFKQPETNLEKIKDIINGLGYKAIEE